MDLNLIIQLVAGLVGGNAAGAALKNLNLGTLGNSIAGVLGGAGGGQLLGMLLGGGAAGAAGATGGMDIGAIIQAVIGGGAGGAALTAIAGIVKNMMAKQ